MSRRKDKIIKMIIKSGELSISSLADSLHVSMMTIRRDVDELLKQQVLQKGSAPGTVHLRVRFQVDPGYSRRHQMNLHQKIAIAMEASKLLQDGMSVGLDASTTALELAKHLNKFKNIKAITNSLLIPTLLTNHPSLSLILSGGSMRPEAFSMVGSIACNTLNQYHYDYAFFSVNAINAEHGLTDTSEEEILTKQIMMQNASVRVLLADSSKFGYRSFCRCCGIERIDILITDKEAGKEEVDAFRKNGTRVILA